MTSHIIDLIWNEIETNEAAYQIRENAGSPAQVVFADHQAQGAADAMRQHVWELCAEGLRRRAVG